MKSFITAFVFGGIVTLVIYAISDYGVADWQFWAAFLSIGAGGFIHAYTP